MTKEEEEIVKKPGIFKRIVSRLMKADTRIAQYGGRAIPRTYAGIVKMQAKGHGMTSEEYKKILGGQAKARQKARLIASIRRPPVGIPMRKMVPIQRGAQMLFPYTKLRMPMYPQQAVSKPTSKGRGRPSGTYKYGMPIQQYKRLLRVARARARATQILAMAQARERRIMEMRAAPPQVVSQYAPQPEYVSQPVVQQQIQPPLKRPIIPVFKSSGGSPYPPVEDRPLQTNPQGDFYEDVDLMSGRRIIKRRLPKEAWTQ